MGISRFLYCLKEGVKNIGRNIWFSLASTAIISACIFLFCLLFALAANVQYMVKRAQATVGITVFFEEALPEAEIIIDAACTAGPDAALHEKALDLMEALQMTIINR